MSAPSLELREHRLAEVRLGERTRARPGSLVLAPADVVAAARCAPPIDALAVDVVHPGESVRINRVLDVLEPRCKLNDSQDTFPGTGTAETRCGTGVTVALTGVAVVATGSFLSTGGAFEQYDCLIDMAGPGAAHTPFGGTTNVVLSYTLRDGADQQEAEQVIREANARVARWLAGLVAHRPPDRTTVIQDPQLMAGAGNRLRVAYVCQLISEGAIHDTLLYGRTTAGMAPRVLAPREMFDGALVSADFHYACQRVPTWLYQRNPVVTALQARADDFELAGVIVGIRQESDGEKRAAAQHTIALARELGVVGLVTHPAVGGNAQLDALYVVQEAERAGIRTAMVVQEMAGPEGADPGLVDFVPEADLLISTGNREEHVRLPPVDRVLGGDTLLDGRPAGAAASLPLRLFCCSTSQVGALPQRAAAA